ncbi:hypothetical protein KV205_07045 [Streptomyces sp. SKN60]|uniref:hypothetical protein n=1 Tax=Streptomyces sp. SKN60 TaxID=2855506 RepID=UPI0022457C5F|nr:hypothetical protein [Streptomyces sp. SKN60]MCX2180286.1 hypothetical protein [Streptomyces sp. SKN60]
MSTFTEAVLERVRAARVRLETALAAEDAFGAALAEEELDDALRLARKHGIETDANADTDSDAVGDEGAGGA